MSRRRDSLPMMAFKVFAGVFLSWVAVGIIGILIAARSPASLRLGEADIRVALLRFRAAGRRGEPPPLWAVSAEHPLPARGPNIHPPTREMVSYKGRSSADSGKWGYDEGTGRIFIDCTHTDSRGSPWTAY